MEEPDKRRLMVRGLSRILDPSLVEDYFRRWGEIEECIFPTDGRNRLKGYGFLTFKESSVVDGIQKSRPHIIDGKRVTTSRFIPDYRSSFDQVMFNVVFVRNVPLEISMKDLCDYFGTFGNIIYVRVIYKRTRAGGMYCFIKFDDYDAADKIILHKYHLVAEHYLEVSKAWNPEVFARERRYENPRYETKYRREKPGPKPSAAKGANRKLLDENQADKPKVNQRAPLQTRPRNSKKKKRPENPRKSPQQTTDENETEAPKVEFQETMKNNELASAHDLLSDISRMNPGEESKEDQCGSASNVPFTGDRDVKNRNQMSEGDEDERKAFFEKLLSEKFVTLSISDDDSSRAYDTPFVPETHASASKNEPGVQIGRETASDDDASRREAELEKTKKLEARAEGDVVPEDSYVRESKRMSDMHYPCEEFAYKASSSRAADSSEDLTEEFSDAVGVSASAEADVQFSPSR